MIRVAILGSTGSIGQSALRVIDRHPDRFKVVGLAAHRNVDGLSMQASRFGVPVAVLSSEDASPPTDGPGGTEWRTGRGALLEMAADPDVDVVINALVGAAGLEPTLAALGAGHRLALANKESLVAGGPLVLEAAERGGGDIVPIDSEHSAILQCLDGREPEEIERVIITASGGPFRGRTAAELREVRPEDALRHPTWDMGAKITIDSASLANKALEVIEAHYLYDLDYDQIDAVIHPQSIIHSFVEFVDGSVLAQLGFPTMELPILYALSYPARVADGRLRTFDPVASASLTFEAIDHGAFPMFGLGVEAGRRGGTVPAAYNASNEVAVQAFLRGEIRFPEIAHVVESALAGAQDGGVTSIDQVLESDRVAREAAVRSCEELMRTRMGST